MEKGGPEGGEIKREGEGKKAEARVPYAWEGGGTRESEMERDPRPMVEGREPENMLPRQRCRLEIVTRERGGKREKGGEETKARGREGETRRQDAWGSDVG